MLTKVFTIFLAILSPDLFNIALGKTAGFVVSTSFQQITSVVGFLYNALIKVNPKRSLKRLLPLLIASIYKEINIYGAGIIVDTEILLGDCILVQNIYLLYYSLTKVRDSILAQKEELFAITKYVQLKCKRSPKMIASKITRRLLYNLTAIYTVNYLIYKKDELKNKLTYIQGKTTNLKKFNVIQYKPSDKEINFAAKLSSSQCNMAIDSLTNLIGPTLYIKLDSSRKEQSNEVS